ncbi:MAG: sugar phosphate isomerase/epimerase family protein [Planctomycetota bacterium]
MKLGVMAALFGGMKFAEALEYCRKVGLDAIELPVGGYPGKPFFDPAEVNESRARQDEVKGMLSDHGLSLSALAVHGNPVSPDRDAAKVDHEAFRTAVELAPKLGTDIVVTFSGCPGGSATDTMPNWVTCAWPPEYEKILKYQWNDVLIPYWKEESQFCAQHGVKVAWEAHPGFCVYNPDTLLRLSEACCHDKAKPNLGANLDPSHFFWQGIDPIETARVFGEAGLLFYCHAKDTAIDPHETRINGTLDARSYGDLKHRSWVFRTCGYGHGDEFWKPFVSMLRRYGYDGVLSIEHEDSYMSMNEGFEKAVDYLRGVLIKDAPDGAWWF